MTPSFHPFDGNDYAIGGATTSDLPAELGSFFAAHPSGAPSSALFTFSIGANDLFAILDGMAPVSDLPVDAQNVANAAEELELAGAKKLMLFDVPNLGLTPRIQDAGVPGLPAEASMLAQTFNTAVLADIALDAPLLRVYDIDAYDLMTEAVADPKKFGFSNVTDPCYVGPFRTPPTRWSRRNPRHGR
jgi:outer membrane lipase/esterase